MRSFLHIFIPAIILLASCNKDEESYIIIEPTLLFEEVSCGDILSYNVRGFSVQSFQTLEISLKPEKEFSRVLFDTLLESSRFNFSIEFEVPVMAESFTEADLVFKATEDNGNTVSFIKLLHINNLNLLNETTGHEIFSGLAVNSNSFDAFSFLTNTPLHSDLADSSLLDIVDATDSTFRETESLSRKWKSPAGAKFVRFNDFDFGNANQSDLILSFRAGKSSPFIDNLNEKDIILVEFNQNDTVNHYCAVKINTIIDTEGIENDRYIFDLKK